MYIACESRRLFRLLFHPPKRRLLSQAKMRKVKIDLIQVSQHVLIENTVLRLSNPLIPGEG